MKYEEKNWKITFFHLNIHNLLFFNICYAFRNYALYLWWEFRIEIYS